MLRLIVAVYLCLNAVAAILVIGKTHYRTPLWAVGNVVSSLFLAWLVIT